MVPEPASREVRLDSLTIGDDDKGSASFEGVKHDFLLELPENYDGAPLIVMLHGYGNSAETMRTQVAIDEDANARGYAVLYVTGAPDPDDTTSSKGWNSGISDSGNNDVDFLCALVNELCNTFSLDSSRVYVVGFSNGAFMTHRLAVETSGVFAAVVSVAGMMPASIWDARPSECNISVFQITGGQDDVVPQNSNGSARYSQNPAIEDVMDYYVAGNGLSLEQSREVGNNSLLTIYGTPDSNTQVWNLYIPDGVHSWPDERYSGFVVNDLILEFLDTQSGLHATDVSTRVKPPKTEEPTPTPFETVSFGTYEGQPLEWMVLDEDDDKMLVICSEAVCAREFNSERVETTWETSDLREWLNGEFFESAFDEDEQARILTSNVTADANPYYDTEPGNDTEDNVFLLSVVEAEQYFATDDKRICEYNGEACWWWLRSTGFGQQRASMICVDGTIGKSYGYFVDSNFQAVRPVMWISK